VTKAIIETNHGKIVLNLLPDNAPETVRSFIKLADPGFMIQGGDPNSKQPDKSKWGTGGPGFNLKAEFNSRSHLRGIVSMARSTDPDSAGSQFFIVTTDSTFLDNQYTVFAEVIEGMEVADTIVNLERNENDCPLQEVKMIHVTTE
jgi:peptidyl-prolyl cis-trans isomerase B (cyclophilin B)